jgi:hypothetical protein
MADTVTREQLLLRTAANDAFKDAGGDPEEWSFCDACLAPVVVDGEPRGAILSYRGADGEVHVWRLPSGFEREQLS